MIIANQVSVLGALYKVPVPLMYQHQLVLCLENTSKPHAVIFHRDRMWEHILKMEAICKENPGFRTEYSKLLKKLTDQNAKQSKSSNQRLELLTSLAAFEEEHFGLRQSGQNLPLKHGYKHVVCKSGLMQVLLWGFLDVFERLWTLLRDASDAQAVAMLYVDSLESNVTFAELRNLRSKSNDTLANEITAGYIANGAVSIPQKPEKTPKYQLKSLNVKSHSKVVTNWSGKTKNEQHIFITRQRRAVSIGVGNTLWDAMYSSKYHKGEVLKITESHIEDLSAEEMTALVMDLADCAILDTTEMETEV